MRVILVNRFFFPDHSATSQMLSDLAFHLSVRGWEVHVITSRLRYDDPAVSLPPRELLRGVQVHRVWTSRFGRMSLPGRVSDYLCFYLGAVWAVFALARRGDVVLAKTDPPMLSAVIGLPVRLRGARLVNWLQDVFPEVAAALGVRLATGLPGRVLRFWRDASLRMASANIVIGEAMGARLRYVLAPDRLHVIHNWSDDSAIVPLAPSRNTLRTEWGLSGKFVVGYSGNMGRAHSLAPVLQAAELLRGERDIVFVLIGDGVGRAALEAEVRAKGLSNVKFQPYQPRGNLGLSLTVPDVHLVSLRPELEGLIVPSKAYGVLAAGRSIIFMGAADGEIGSLVLKNGCGEVVSADDGFALAAAVSRLKGDPVRCTAMGARARAALEAGYTQAKSLAAWDTVLRSLRRAG